MSSRTAAVRLTIGELSEADRHDRPQHPQPPVARAAPAARAARRAPATTAREHVERLRLIQAMQADGFNLEAIRRLLIGSELRRAATMPVEAPAVLTVADLEARFGAPTRQRWPRPSGSACSSRSATAASRRRARRCCAPPRTRSRSASRARRRPARRRGGQAGCAAIARTFVARSRASCCRPVGEADPVAAVEGLRPVAAQTVLGAAPPGDGAEAGRAIGPLPERVRSPRAVTSTGRNPRGRDRLQRPQRSSSARSSSVAAPASSPRRSSRPASTASSISSFEAADDRGGERGRERPDARAARRPPGPTARAAAPRSGAGRRAAARARAGRPPGSRRSPARLSAGSAASALEVGPRGGGQPLLPRGRRRTRRSAISSSSSSLVREYSARKHASLSAKCS